MPLPFPRPRQPTDPDQIEDAVETDAEIIMKDKVLSYRVEQFTKMGFTTHQARALAFARHADIHAVRRAVQMGCDPHLAFDIFH